MLDDEDAALRARAATVIPNGMYGHQSTALLPATHPQFFEKAEGAYLWDANGNRLIDYMCAYGPNLLGYGNTTVDDAFLAQLKKGDTMTGPSPVMIDLAEAFVGMVRHATWAMFCKNGTDANSMALVISRAATGRRKVLIARGAYHGAAPWCTPVKTGTLEEDRSHQLLYVYNDVASLEDAAAAAGDDLAAVFATPFKHDAFTAQEKLDATYARRARALCDSTGAVLIVDDVRAGFRLSRDCSWSVAGVEPDLSSWGKVIANGHPISALLGNERLRQAAASVYVTGSFWFSAAPMAAALATLKLVSETDYLEHTIRLGEQLREGLDAAARSRGIDFRQSGPVQMPLFLFGDDADFRQGYFWCGEMLKHGIYMHPWHNMFLCAAMTQADITSTVTAASAAFHTLLGARQTLKEPPQIAFLRKSAAH